MTPITPMIICWARGIPCPACPSQPVLYEADLETRREIGMFEPSYLPITLPPAIMVRRFL